MSPLPHGPAARNDLVSRLWQILARPTCIVGVGNPWRKDDVVGALIAERLQRELPASGQLGVVNAEDVIENHVFTIADGPAQNVLIIDAVRGAGGDHAQPGTLLLGPIDDLEDAAGGWSTHKLALSTAAAVLKHHGKSVWLLGIVAADTDYGNEVGREILDSAEAVIDMIRTQGRMPVPALHGE